MTVLTKAQTEEHEEPDCIAVPDRLSVGGMTKQNGRLIQFSGAQSGTVFDHHLNDVLMGAMDLTACGLVPKDAVILTGSAGSICEIQKALGNQGSGTYKGEDK